MALFVLVEFTKGKALSTISRETIIHKENISIGDEVILKWNNNKYYDAIVLDQSDNFDKLEALKEKMLKKGKVNNVQPKGKKRNKIISESSDEDPDQPPEFEKPKNKKTKTTSAAHALEIDKLKSIDNSNDAQIEELKKENESLRAEITVHKEQYLQMQKLLQLANELVDKLTAKRDSATRHTSFATSNSVQQVACTVNDRLARESEAEAEAEVEEEEDVLSNPAVKSNSNVQQLKWKSSDKDVVKLLAQHAVYVHKDCLQRITANATTASHTARNLAKAIFSDEALASCSVFGGQSKGPKGKSDVVRPALHGEAMNAIIGFILHIAPNHRWAVKKTDIVRSLGSMLSAIRSKYTNGV